jgi:ABC-type sugar transport system ATPase subunit
MVVGREVEQLYPVRLGEAGEVVLEVSKLTRPHHFEDVSFKVRQNEILGLYGLLGSGPMDVLRALYGSPPASSGEIRLSGLPVAVHSPAQAKASGIGLVSEDRKREGLVLGLSVSDNLTLGNWEGLARGGVLQRREELARTAWWTGQLGIRASGPGQAVGTLSGGNQQKVVLARWLNAGSQVLLLAEPTRGVDVGARADIYQVLEELREQGLALVLVSTDLEEVLALSDRILVFERGRVVREFGRQEATQELLLSTAAGEDE